MSDSCTFLTCQNFALRQYPVFLRDFWRFSSETGWPLSKTSCPSMISMAPLRFCDKIWHRLYPFSPGTFPRGTLTVFCNTWQRRRATHTRVGINDHKHTTRNCFSIGHFLQSRWPTAAVATDDALTWVGRVQTNPRNQTTDQGLRRVYHLCILWLVTVSTHRHRPK